MDINNIQSGNAILEVRTYGNASNEAVILLHGGPGVPDEMTEVREYLSESFRVITFNQRGTGKSSGRWCTYFVDEYLDDINAIADNLNIDRFHLFGHSWGGLYAHLYARKYPARLLSLFMCSAAAGSGHIWKLVEKEVFSYNRKMSTKLQWLLMGIDSVLGFLGSDKAYRRLYRQVIINYNKGYNIEPPDDEKLAGINARAGNLTRRNIKNYEFYRTSGQVAYPVMITFGQHDVYQKSRKYLTEQFPSASVVTIPNSGHTPWKHNWNAFREVIRQFYRQIQNKDLVTKAVI